jgi:nitronate monooxygenase
MGLIDDIPTCEELISRIVREAEELIIGRLGGMVTPAAAAAVSA